MPKITTKPHDAESVAFRGEVVQSRRMTTGALRITVDIYACDMDAFLRLNKEDMYLKPLAFHAVKLNERPLDAQTC